MTQNIKIMDFEDIEKSVFQNKPKPVMLYHEKRTFEKLNEIKGQYAKGDISKQQATKLKLILKKRFKACKQHILLAKEIEMQLVDLELDIKNTEQYAKKLVTVCGYISNRGVRLLEEFEEKLRNLQ